MVKGSELYPTVMVRRKGGDDRGLLERVVRVSVDRRTALLESQSGGVRVREWVSCEQLDLEGGDEA